MKKYMTRVITGFIVAVCFFQVSAMADQKVLIGTGSKDGVYYYAGKAISRLVDLSAQGLSCEVVTTPGSLYNLSNVRDGGLDIGIAQSDWQFYAVTGTGPMKFVAGGFTNLRSLFSLHAEPFTLVVRRDSGISAFQDLPGRRVNIGNPGSGQRGTMEILMKAMGWTKSDFRLAEELSASEQSLALCNRRIEAMVYTVGHPNESVAKAVRLCSATLARVDGPVIDTLVRENPYYAEVEIPGNLYPGIPESTKTFGVTATVVTSSDVDEETVYTIVKAVFDNLDTFRKLHPAFRGLQPETMVKSGLSAELHEGARKVFIEKGLL